MAKIGPPRGPIGRGGTPPSKGTPAEPAKTSASEPHKLASKVAPKEPLAESAKGAGGAPHKAAREEQGKEPAKEPAEATDKEAEPAKGPAKGGTDEQSDDDAATELIRTGKVGMPVDPPAGDDTAAVKGAMDDVLRRQTGKDPDSLSEAERDDAFRNEFLDQSGITAKLTAGRRIIGADHPHDKSDDELKDELSEVADREFIAETLGVRSEDLTPKDLAEFDRIRDRAAVEAETGKEFDDLSPLEAAQARQAIRNRAFDTRVGEPAEGASGDGTESSPGSIPGFGDHGGRVPAGGFGSGAGAGGSGSGSGDGGGSGTGGGDDGGGGGSWGGRRGAGPGTEPSEWFGTGDDAGRARDPGPGGGPGGGSGGQEGGDTPGGSGSGSGTGSGSGSGSGDGGAGQDSGTGGGGSDAGGGTEPSGGPDGAGSDGADTDGSLDLRPVDVNRSDGTTERGYITPDGDIVDEDGNVIPADEIDGYSTVIGSGESDDSGSGDDSDGDDSGGGGSDGGSDSGGSDSGGDDSGGGGSDGGESADTEAGGGVGFTPNPDGTGGGRVLEGLHGERVLGRLPHGGPPETESQPVDDGAGGVIGPVTGGPLRPIPGVDQPGPFGPEGAQGTGRPITGSTRPDTGDIDPPDDTAFGTGGQAPAASGAAAPAAADSGEHAVGEHAVGGHQAVGAASFGGQHFDDAEAAFESSGIDAAPAFGDVGSGHVSDDADAGDDSGEDDAFDLDG